MRIGKFGFRKAEHIPLVEVYRRAGSGNIDVVLVKECLPRFGEDLPDILTNHVNPLRQLGAGMSIHEGNIPVAVHGVDAVCRVFESRCDLLGKPLSFSQISQHDDVSHLHRTDRHS